MESSLPETQTAIVANELGQLVVSCNVLLPELEPDTLLVRTMAVALNPVDVKLTGPMATEGAVAGGDCAGIVVAIGSGVRAGRFEIGDRVCAPIASLNPLNPRVGAFAEYTATIADCTLKIPDGMAFEAAATLGISIATIGYALFRSLNIPGHPDEPATKPTYVLVYGGSTATGTMAMQVIRRSGLIPITTCSPRNFALVEGYGAEKSFDYHDPESANAVRAYTKNALSYALDCVCEGSSMKFCYAAIGRAGGKYTTLEPYPEHMHTRKRVKPEWLLGPALMGKDVPWKEPYYIKGDPELRVFGAEWFSCAQRLLDRQEIRPHPTKIGDEVGFDGVLDGLELLKKKAVSGEKLVYRITAFDGQADLKPTEPIAF
ncbi:hypothetical protein DL768_010761 [Monosporascus sp. mg162]|nr:hypothetical protein DL768_010761 [Monosporascus sp. mg162]